MLNCQIITGNAKKRGLKQLCRLVAVALALAALSGCSEWKERRQIEQAVTAYCNLLAQGYRTLDMGPVSQAATQDLAKKAYYHMAALGEARLKMAPVLKSIKFSDLRIADGNAQVDTLEKWDYSYISLDTGKTVFNNHVAYEMEYHLKDQKGKWLVAAVITKAFHETNNSNNIFFQRPGKK